MRSVSARLGALPRTTGGLPPGAWVPLTQRLLRRVARRYAPWMSFVRSHRGLAVKRKGRGSNGGPTGMGKGTRRA